ncbi:hypothetical protein Ahy_B10g106131 [Arachis hypogaea]|uniref:BUD13 homolog n=2 Tax=Arachis TaxID=3817 RepID=A0A444X9T4_ARAHY|nr:hypothetical protein Ahy_B10g106131 [Arachis hypogaea]
MSWTALHGQWKTRGDVLRRMEESPWIGVVDRALRMETWWWLRHDGGESWGASGERWGVTSGKGASSDRWGVTIGHEKGEVKARWWLSFLRERQMRDDPELDNMLKERLRWGDPMAHLVKKKYPEPVLPDLGEGEKMKESGFVVPQDIPDHSWLKRGLDAAPNRYGIRPGRHWDGVDRSNGFEKELFKRTNERQARDREAYLWSVSNM